MRPLCLLLVAASTFAQSPTPIQTKSKTSAPKAVDGSKDQKPAASPALPTTASAPSPTSTIQQQPVKDADHDSATLKRPKDWLAEAFAPSTWSNWALFVGAGITAIIALRTLKAIREQARIAGAALDATRQAAEAAQASAVAATESNALTRESNATTEAATELTKQSLILSQRPRLVVRNVFIADEQRITNWREIPGGPSEDPFSGRIRIVNIGMTDAYVTAVRCSVFLGTSLPMESPIATVIGELDKEIRLAPGVYGTRSFQEDWVVTTADHLEPIRASGIRLHIMGWIIYRDELHNVRTTWFCRKWNGQEGRFEAVDNPDYESAD